MLYGGGCFGETERSGRHRPYGALRHPIGNIVQCSEKDMEKKRTRNYATVVYPESAPADWIRLLQEQCVPALISPLHDKDLNTDGTPKKSIIM